MNNQERQALISSLEILKPEIKGIPALTKAVEIALATLTADRKAIAQKIHWMCERTGASHFIAAEWALDELLDSQDNSKEFTKLDD